MSASEGLRETGFLLHHFPYSDQSAIVACLLEKSGRVDFVQRNFYGNARRKGPSGRLEMFQPIEFQWRPKPNAQLQSIQTLSYVRTQLHFWSGQKLALGYYINELYYRLVKAHLPATELYALYQHAIETLESIDEQASPTTLGRVLRSLELAFLRLLGHELCVCEDAQQQPLGQHQRYIYDIEQGYIEHPSGVRGGDLLEHDLMQMTDEALISWKKNCRFVLDQLLNFKPLKSRKIYQDLMKYNPKGTA
jgi:DNA repair protein RecO (recombination protein O)